MIEVLVLGLVFMVLGVLVVSHAVYTLKRRPRRGEGWWWGRHPVLTFFAAGWPNGYASRIRAAWLIVYGLAFVAFGARLLVAALV
ncbi:MAG: hypothetical protein WDA27_03300 [Actinomycetota bacterium]